MAEYELNSFSFEVYVSVYSNSLGRKDQNPAILHTRKKKLIRIKNKNKNSQTEHFFFRCLQHCHKTC